MARHVDLQRLRKAQLRRLPAQTGVYALCDLDQTPIYVGRSRRAKGEGIRARVGRHLTSARSDVVANRQLDVWEIGYVWGWPVPDDKVVELESFLFHQYDAKSRLLNRHVPKKVRRLSFHMPEPVRVQILTDEEISFRKEPANRFPRQVRQFNELLDYLLHAKDEKSLRRTLDAHFARVNRFFEEFQKMTAITSAEVEDE
jgi:hypothetical protein